MLIASSPARAQFGGDIGTLPRVTAPTAVGASPNLAAPPGSSTYRELAPPAGVDRGLIEGFYPALTIAASRHSDALRDGSGQSDTSYSLIPELVWRFGLGRHDVQLGYGAVYQWYDEFDSEDYSNQALRAALGLDLTEILNADLYAWWIEGEEARGSTGSRLNLGSEKDEYDDTGVGGRVTLGRRTNTLQLHLGAETADLDYTNNNQDARDRTIDRVEGGLFWNITARTALFLDASQADIDYDLGEPGRDSTETITGVGVSWEASVASSFIVKVGNLEKEYDDPAIAGYDDDTWLAKMVWAPRDRTRFNFYTSKRTEESADFAARFYVSELVGASLNQALGDRWNLNLYGNSIDDEYDSGRVDDISDYGVSLAVDLADWLAAGVAYSRFKRDSNDPDAVYDDDIITVFLTGRRPYVGQ
jgi:hypothetical protein